MSMFKKTKAKTPKEYIDLQKEPWKSQIQTLHKLIRKAAPDLKPHIRAGMIGYGPYRYKYASGREGDWCVVALANQKNHISVYVCEVGEDGKYAVEKHKSELGKVSVGRSCIRCKRVEDVNLDAMTKLIAGAAKSMKKYLN